MSRWVVPCNRHENCYRDPATGYWHCDDCSVEAHRRYQRRYHQRHRTEILARKRKRYQEAKHG